MAKKWKEEKGPDQGVKIRSLGHMQDKLKRNIHDDEQRYVLTTTTFVLVGSVYAPDPDANPRQAKAGEIIRYSERLEWIIQTKNKVHPLRMLSQQVAESIRTLQRKERNPNSKFYHHMRSALIDYLDPQEFRGRAAYLGGVIRETARSVMEFEEEDNLKMYIGKESDIKLGHGVVEIIEAEYDALRRRLPQR